MIANFYLPMDREVGALLVPGTKGKQLTVGCHGERML